MPGLNLSVQQTISEAWQFGNSQFSPINSKNQQNHSQPSSAHGDAIEAASPNEPRHRTLYQQSDVVFQISSL